MNTKLIAFCGFAGSGKDTAAEHLIKNYNFKKDSFATPLKDAVSSIFGWDREMLEGSSEVSRIWREEIDKWWAQRLNIPHLTPRWVLQNIGTKVMRENFHFDIWQASLEKRILESNRNIVITDCRFKNELSMVKQLNGTIIAVMRSPKPDWWDIAEAANSDTFLHAPEAVKALEERGIHQSEYDWIGFPINYTLENYDTIDSMYNNLENIMDLI